MAVNKVIFGGEVVLDLTSDTVTEASVLSGKKFHDKSGAIKTGSCTYDADTSDANASADDILLGQTAYVNGNKVEGEMPNNGAVSGSISTKDGVYTVPYGFHDGSGKVQISATEKQKLIATNIRKGVSILGVTGSMEEDTENPAPTRTVTPSTSRQVITPGTGYTCLREVDVEPIPYVESQNTYGTTVTIG